jgi:hypothetical protein
MLIGNSSLPFIREYVEALDKAIKTKDPGSDGLTRLQKVWLSFIILGTLITNSVCWAKCERFSLGQYSIKQISWFFRRSRIVWDLLLAASVLQIVEAYGIKEGVLAIDDTDRERSKNTTQISQVHKIKSKKTSGYFNGQNLVILVLVSGEVTIPVGFRFYEPDPERSAWRKEDDRLKRKKVAKQYRPKAPLDNPKYPSKQDIASELCGEFCRNFPKIKVRAIVGDSHYGTSNFMDEVALKTSQNQVITKIRKTQLISVNNKEIAVSEFFKNYQGRKETIVLRGQKKELTVCMIKCKVKSHKKKYFVIALKEAHEKEYRYLIARDMTWRYEDIIKTYAFRWLVEVFIQDWKQCEGWNKLAKQTGTEGSTRGVILSLLTDHALLLHEEQKALLKNHEPIATVSSIREKVIMESLKEFIYDIVSSSDPRALFDKYVDRIHELFNLKTSIKHMRPDDMEGLNYYTAHNMTT